VFGNIATIVITGLFSRELSAARREAQRCVEIHAWRLQQLVPVDARGPRLATEDPITREQTRTERAT
jgi:hypothetical protein